MSDSQTSDASIAQIEAELAATRAHLATTVDELVTRGHPKEIVRRQVESARLALIDATHTAEGELRTERIAGALAAVAAVLVAFDLLRRRLS